MTTRKKEKPLNRKYTMKSETQTKSCSISTKSPGTVSSTDMERFQGKTMS